MHKISIELRENSSSKTSLTAGTSQVDNQQPRLNRVRFNDYRKHKEVSRVNIN